MLLQTTPAPAKTAHNAQKHILNAPATRFAQRVFAKSTPHSADYIVLMSSAAAAAP